MQCKCKDKGDGDGRDDGVDDKVESFERRSGAEKRMMQPAACRAFLRRRLASEFEGIVDGFVKEAKSGSVPHLKLATELLKPSRKAQSGRKSETVRSLERMMKSRPVKSEFEGE